MTNTPINGLPYPESTADLNQGANDIKALALALDPMIGGSTKKIAYVNKGVQWPDTDAQSVSRYTAHGLTTVEGGIVVSVSDGNTLVTVATATGGNVFAVHVLVNGGEWANKSFQACAIIWGT
jgi:hypothetical protein